VLYTGHHWQVVPFSWKYTHIVACADFDVDGKEKALVVHVAIKESLPRSLGVYREHYSCSNESYPIPVTMIEFCSVMASNDSGYANSDAAWLQWLFFDPLLVRP
jgi:hypothetical protein